MKQIDAFKAPLLCATLLFMGLGIVVGQGWVNPNGWGPWAVAGVLLLLAACNLRLFRFRFARPKPLNLFGQALLITHAGVLRVVATVLIFWLIAYLENKAPLPMAAACITGAVYYLSLIRVRRPTTSPVRVRHAIGLPL